MANKYLGLLMVGLLLATALGVSAQDEFKPTVDFKGSRIAIGYLDSEENGSYKDGSFQAPDCKLRFNWTMQENMVIVTRLSLSNIAVGAPDYFYIQYKNLFSEFAPSLKDSAFNPAIKIGRVKVDIGEETFSDNPVESVVINNSAGLVAGYDEGLELSQSLHKENLGVPIKWSLSFFNGNTGSGADDQQGKALCFKLGANPIPELYVSGSYYDSGEITAVDAEVKYAGLGSRPTNATHWSRTITEIDLRYDFQPGKENRLSPGAPAFSDSKAHVRVAYGQFEDDGSDKAAPIVQITDREGTYYFVDGLYNATAKVYVAARYSMIAFDKDTIFASLNGVNATEYKRISAGVGYRLSGNTHLKAEFTTNTEEIPTGAVKQENDQYSMLFTSKF